MRALKRQIQRGLRVGKFFTQGVLFSMFNRWRNCLPEPGSVLLPHRCKPGVKVMLSAEGKEFEFANGRRIEGDNGAGVLVKAVLSDNTMWKVRWLSSNLTSTYFTGSCGRLNPPDVRSLVCALVGEKCTQIAPWMLSYADKDAIPWVGRFHIRSWLEGKKAGGRKKLAGVSEDENLVSGFQAALAELRGALEVSSRATGALQTIGSVTPSYGGRVRLPCPTGTKWYIGVAVAPKSVTEKEKVRITATEFPLFGVSRWIPTSQMRQPTRILRCSQSLLVVKMVL